MMSRSPGTGFPGPSRWLFRPASLPPRRSAGRLRPWRSARRLRPWRADAGSAIAEFVMISALLSLVFVAVVQLVLVVYVRNTVIDSAVAGARQAGLADQSMRDGAELTEQLITASIGESYARNIRVQRIDHEGTELIEVTVTTAMPVIGLWGPPGMWELTGHAVPESLDR